MRVARAAREAAAYKRRMGWKFPWVSSGGTDFNFDFGLFTEDRRKGTTTTSKATAWGAELHRRKDDDELRGLSAFALEDGGRVPHVLDVRPRRRRAERDVPAARPRAEGAKRERASGWWSGRHDEYEAPASGRGVVIAHVAGVPVEELIPLAYGSGAMLAAARAWAAIRRRDGHRVDFVTVPDPGPERGDGVLRRSARPPG